MIEWRDIKDYEGQYQVSNTGLVRSLDRIVCSGRQVNTIHGKVRKQNIVGKGYCQVLLCKNGKVKAFLVHRLVAQAFIPNSNEYPCINHKDGNPLNNSVENLEWCTYKYNNEYNNRIERSKAKISFTLTGRGRCVPYTPEQIENIRQGAIRGWVKRRNRKR